MANQTSERSWLDVAIVLAAQIISAISLLTFAGAIILNSLVFSQWGLSFLQLATLSDVVLSGLAFVPRLLLVVALLSSGLLLGIFKPSKKIISFVIAFLILKQSAYYISFIFEDLQKFTRPIWPTVNIFTAVGVGFVGGYMFSIARRAGAARYAALTALVPLGVFSAFTGVMLIAWEGQQTVATLAKDGFNPLSQALNPPTGCSKPASVFWVGERATVYRCGEPIRIYFAVSLRGEGEAFARLQPGKTKTPPSNARTSSPP